MIRDWDRVLAPLAPWKEAYKETAAAVREFLAHPDNGARIVIEAGGTLSTTELVECLYPAARARGEGITARKRLFKALLALASHDLADCATRGDPVQNKRLGHPVRHYRWHAPAVKPEWTWKHVEVIRAYTGEKEDAIALIRDKDQMAVLIDVSEDFDIAKFVGFLNV